MPLSEFTLHRRVTFPETDSAGIVHFSNYFRYMEEAEHALWRAAGISIAARDAEVGFPRVSASFDYHRPLHFEDEFAARIRIVSLRERSLRYVCTLTRDGEKIATGTLAIACVTRDANGVMKSRPIPPDIAALFEVSPEVQAEAELR